MEPGTLRYRSPVDARGYTMAWNCVLLDARLSDGAYRTYEVLRFHAQQADRCWPGQQALADERGCKVRALQNHLKELEAAGLITIERRGKTETNIYWIEDVRDAYTGEGRAAGRPAQTKAGPGDAQKNAGQEAQKNAYHLRRKNLRTKKNHLSVREEEPYEEETAAEEGRRGDTGSVAAARLIEALAAAGVNRADAARLSLQSPEECRRQLEFLPFVTEFKTSRGAYLRSAIEQGFAPPPAFDAAQNARRVAEREQTERRARQQKETAQQAERERLKEAQERLKTEQPDLWAAITRQAEAQLPPPLKSRPNGPAYQAALEGKINALVAAAEGATRQGRPGQG